MYGPYADMTSALQGLSDAIKTDKSDAGTVYVTSASPLVSIPVAFYRLRAPGAYQWFHGIPEHHFIHIPGVPDALTRAAHKALLLKPSGDARLHDSR